MPEGYVEVPRAPPPPPPPVDDSDIMDLSMELNAASIDDVPGDLDERGMERVPMADPGLDVRNHAEPVDFISSHYVHDLAPSSTNRP